jgi:UDP-N-acetylglucosamine 2-epimerase (non-hydrolysing)
MLDSLEMLREKIEKQNSYLNFDLEPNNYGIVTLHRPSNVDDPEVLRSLCNNLVQIADRIPLVFPIHPRTRKNLQQNRLMSIIDNCRGLLLPNPVSYINFMNLVFNCRFVITDSGGIQEETTYLNIPCLTVRPNTERPITITHGTNQLCGIADLKDKAEAVLSGYLSNGKKIQFWDGKTAERIVQFLGRLR